MLKKIILFLSIFALVFFVVSCGKSSKKVSLVYSLWDANQKPAMEVSIQEFMKQNPNIEVKIELVEWNDYWTKITTGVAAGTLPDVFWGHLAYFSGLITKGALMDITPLIEKDKIDLSIYYPSLVKSWSYESKQYGIPKDWDTICVFYNKDLFDKANVPYPSENWTWNPKDGGDYLKILQKLTIDENGKNSTEKGFDKNKIVQYGTAGIKGNNNQEGWLNFIWMNGGTGILDKPYGHKFVMDEPKTIETLKFWGNLANKYGVSPMPGSEAASASYWELFTAGKVAVLPAGSWMLSSARSSLPFKWDVAYLPKGPAGRVSCFNGLAHVIYSKTKHPDEAWKLAKWMDSYESQKIITTYGVVFPAIPELMDIYLSSTKDKGPEHIKYFIEETENTGLWPMHVNWSQIFDILSRELDTAFAGSQSIEDAIKNVKDQVEPLL